MQKLKFKNKRIIDTSNYKSLSDVHLKQMALGATMGFGSNYKTAEDFLEQCGDGDIEDGEVELWDIVDTANPNKPLYEFWYYLGDTGNIFFAGTTNDIGIAMCQDSFDNHTDDDDNDVLAEALEKAYYKMNS
jgi:hypothetical protein